MSKSASIAILCVICTIALLLGVFSCLPGGLEYGEYNVYNSAINLIQGDSMFADSIVATYKVKLDDEANINDVASALKSRLGDMYGRYFCNVDVVSDNKISITIPKTAYEGNISETSILSSVTATGKVEVVSAQEYAQDKVVLTADHVSRMSTQKIASGGTTYYIINVNLNKAGKAIAEEKLSVSTSSWSAYLAIDETVAYGVAYTSNGTLQIYVNSEADAPFVIGLTNSGALGATLTPLETEEVSSIGTLIFAIIFAVIVVATWAFYVVRYKKLALVAIATQLIAIVAFIMFAGIVYFNLFNLAAAIGVVLGYALVSVFTVLPFDALQKYLQEKTVATARYRAFADFNKWNCIVHAIVLVVGIILWLIPTGVTAPLGNALVYCAVLSFTVTMGLNRWFSSFNIGLESARGKKLAK